MTGGAAMGWMFGTTGGVVGGEGDAVGVDTDGAVSCDGNESGTMMACDAVVGSGDDGANVGEEDASVVNT